MSCEYLKVILTDTSIPVVYDPVIIQPLDALYNGKYQYAFTVNAVGYQLLYEAVDNYWYIILEENEQVIISNDSVQGMCPPLTGWYTEVSHIELVNNKLISALYVPDSINGITVASWDDTTKTCLATKGTTYYNKIVGAVKCSNIELIKLELIMYLLAQKDETDALDCVYNGLHFPGAVFPSNADPANSNTYLKTFYDYVSRFCATCIVSVVNSPTPDPIVYRITSESGAVITLENGSDITLE